MNNKIFSIKTDNKTHIELYIFGLHIKFLRHKYACKKKLSPYYGYKKNKTDIRTLPPAEGLIRDIQLANLAILREYDRICTEHNLDYWLIAGSALGAVRHKGFIPWDDDIDVCMPRDDYNKIIDIFNNNTVYENLYAALWNNRKKQSFTTKIRHKSCPHIFVDIFAADYSNEINTKKEQFRITENIINARKKINKKISDKIPPDECLKMYLDLGKKYIHDNYKEKSDLLLGMEWDHFEKNWYIKYESVYPLKKIEFEGCKMNSMNNPEDYLTDYYGDFMDYPKKLGFGHGMYYDITPEEMFVIQNMK